MRRDPAIHIHLSRLAIILDNLGIADPEKTAVAIAEKAVPFAIKNRYVIKTDSVGRKKVRRVIDNSRQMELTVERFNAVLCETRLAAGHSKVTLILKSDPNYQLLKEVANLAYDFAKAFDLPIEEGCRLYINIGLKFMKHGAMYSITKFKYFNERIHKHYEAARVIESDPKPAQTNDFYEAYREMLLNSTGVDRKLTRVEDYVYMVYARTECEMLDAYQGDYLQAQFDEMGRMNLTPNPANLIGENAEKRYYDWLVRNRKGFKGQLVNISVENARSDFERQYIANLRAKNAVSK